MLVFFFSSCTSDENSETTFQINKDVKKYPRQFSNPNRSSAQRFGLAGESLPSQPMPGPQKPKVDYKKPALWKELPLRGMGVAEFEVGEGENICLIRVLAMNGGSVIANLQMKHKSFGLTEPTVEGIEKLPKMKVMGEDAYFLELQGAYETGGGSIPNLLELSCAFDKGPRTFVANIIGPHDLVETERESFMDFLDSLSMDEPALLGAILIDEEKSLFVKLTGSVKEIGELEPTFFEFCASFKMSESNPIEWKLPEGWKQESGLKRSGDFLDLGKLSAGKSSLCSITLFPAGQNLLANVNRWRMQFGMEGLSEEGLASLGKIPMLGVEAVLVRAIGSPEGSGE